MKQRGTRAITAAEATTMNISAASAASAAADVMHTQSTLHSHPQTVRKDFIYSM